MNQGARTRTGAPGLLHFAHRDVVQMFKQTRSRTLLSSAPTIPLCSEDQLRHNQLSELELAFPKAPTHSVLSLRAWKAKKTQGLIDSVSDVIIPPILDVSENCRTSSRLVASLAPITPLPLKGSKAELEGQFQANFLQCRSVLAPIRSEVGVTSNDVVDDLGPHCACLVSELATSAACLPFPTRDVISQDLSKSLRVTIPAQRDDSPENHYSQCSRGVNSSLLPLEAVGHMSALFTPRHDVNVASPDETDHGRSNLFQNRMCVNVDTSKRSEMLSDDDDGNDLWDPGKVFGALEGIAEKPIFEVHQLQAQHNWPIHDLQQSAPYSYRHDSLDVAVTAHPERRTRPQRVKRKIDAGSACAPARAPALQLVLANEFPCQKRIRKSKAAKATIEEPQHKAPLLSTPTVKLLSRTTGKQCTKKKRRKSIEWTKAETAALQASVAELGERDWTLIARGIGTRNKAQCRQKWFGCLRPGLVKGAWSAAENKVLHDLGKAKQQPCFTILSKTVLRGRSVKQIQERWKNHFNPNTNFAPFTELEITTLQSLHRQNFGWSYIAKALVKRTPSQVCKRPSLLVYSWCAL